MGGGARQQELGGRRPGDMGQRRGGRDSQRGIGGQSSGPAHKGTKIQLPPTFWWWPVVLGAPWPGAALLRSVPWLTWPPPVCVPVSSLLLRRSPPVSGLWSTPVQ